MELNVSKISHKIFKFTWEHSLHSTQVEVKIPDLTCLECTVIGDWGPMYTFRLNAQNPVLLRYNGVTFESLQKDLHVGSPMIAVQRDQHPYFIKIEDSQRGHVFHLYLNTDHELGKVDVVSVKDRVKVFESEVFEREHSALPRSPSN